ncbi:hypothetical protein WICPIJ_007116 [Wickerhamomyces pijperi]|uniref:Uncharacterized protein n=1 Tax=Wickerhamomyces pijperi TaxID=599730 RepID=A0A9P8TKD2_WICPI|nr:hypothetical protein WICPIJ_007116 [Wickerhamomyces pijperi]
MIKAKIPPKIIALIGTFNFELTTLMIEEKTKPLSLAKAQICETGNNHDEETNDPNTEDRGHDTEWNGLGGIDGFFGHVNTRVESTNGPNSWHERVHNPRPTFWPIRQVCGIGHNPVAWGK